MKQRIRCQALTYKREELRRTGRTKSGFERHYVKAQCKRPARIGSNMCRQHERLGSVCCSWSELYI